MRLSRIAASLILLTVISTLYSNCSKKLPEEAQNFSSRRVTVPTVTPLDPLVGKMTPASIYSDQAAAVEVSGGRPPYMFTLVQGSAQLGSNGSLSGPFSEGSVLVQVQDQASQSLLLALSVTVRSSGGGSGGSGSGGGGAGSSSNPCQTPWGTTIESGMAVTAFQNSEIVCPATGSCQSETRLCNNGVLSGSFTSPSCSVRPCVYKEVQYSTDQASGYSLCRAYYVDGSLGGYYVPTVPNPQSLPASCSPEEYNRSEYCYVQSYADSESSWYDFRRYLCVSPNEERVSEKYSVSPD